jgi:hypothetical protein
VFRAYEFALLEPRCARGGDRARLARAGPSVSLVDRCHTAARRPRFAGARTEMLACRALGFDRLDGVADRLGLHRRSALGQLLARRDCRVRAARAFRLPTAHRRHRRLARALGFVARCRYGLSRVGRGGLLADWIACSRLFHAHGQQRQRIDIALRIRRDPDAQVNVRGRGVIGRGSDRSDRLSFVYDGVFRNSDRAQSDQCDRIAVGAADGDRAPVSGHGAGEGDCSGRGRTHARAGVAGDIDPAVLPAGIGVVA